MVKNTSGGSKHKGFARKNVVKKDNNVLRISEDEAEVYAQVTKIFGGASCQVVNLNGDQMLCHIRGKFRGRGKRDNFIGNGTWLLVGLREWEKEPAAGKLLNCDVIEVYSDSDKNRLKNNVTSINWYPFINNDNKLFSVADDTNDGIVFSDDKTQEYEDLIEAQLQVSKTEGRNVIITTDDGEEVDVDDI
jgi:initiation factor 1A